MKKIRLESVDSHLKKELKDPEFKRLYELECAKLALAQKKLSKRHSKIT